MENNNSNKRSFIEFLHHDALIYLCKHLAYPERMRFIALHVLGSDKNSVTTQTVACLLKRDLMLDMVNEYADLFGVSKIYKLGARFKYTLRKYIDPSFCLVCGKKSNDTRRKRKYISKRTGKKTCGRCFVEMWCSTTGAKCKCGKSYIICDCPKESTELDRCYRNKLKTGTDNEYYLTYDPWTLYAYCRGYFRHLVRGLCEDKRRRQTLEKYSPPATSCAKEKCNDYFCLTSGFYYKKSTPKYTEEDLIAKKGAKKIGDRKRKCYITEKGALAKKKRKEECWDNFNANIKRLEEERKIKQSMEPFEEVIDSFEE